MVVEIRQGIMVVEVGGAMVCSVAAARVVNTEEPPCQVVGAARVMIVPDWELFILGPANLPAIMPTLPTVEQQGLVGQEVLVSAERMGRLVSPS